MTALLLLAHLALGSDQPPETVAPDPVGDLVYAELSVPYLPRSELGRSRRDWTEVDRQALGTYRAGVVVGGIGAGVTVLGGLAGSLELSTVGGLMLLVGAPLMAGGSLRSARALSETSRERVGRGSGAVAWVLYGGYFAANFAFVASIDSDAALPLAVVAVACLAGSFAASANQNGVNNRHRPRWRSHIDGVNLVILDRQTLALAVTGRW